MKKGEISDETQSHSCLTRNLTNFEMQKMIQEAIHFKSVSLIDGVDRLIHINFI